MKYPKEYMRKAADLVEKEYFKDNEDIEATALLNLAALCIHFLALDNMESWGVTEEEAYYMVLNTLSMPEKHD